MPRRQNESRAHASPAVVWRAAAAGPWTARQLAVLLGLIVAATALRLTGVDQWSFHGSEVPVWQGVTRAADGAAGRHPVATVLLRFLLAHGVLPLPSEVWLRLPFVFVGITVVPLVALVARRLSGDNHVALAAAAACAVHPWFLAASQTASASGFALAAGLGALTLLPPVGAPRRALRTGATALFAAVAIGSHPSGWLVLAMLVAYAACDRWPEANGPARAWGATALCASPLLPAIGLLWSGSLAEGVEPSAAPWTEFAGAFGWSTLGLAAAALAVVRPLHASFVAVALAPLASVALALAAGVPSAANDLVLLLPLPVVLAAAAGLQCFRILRSAVVAADRGEVLAFGLVLGAFLLSLLVESVLFLTVDEGRRPRCREAAAVAARLGGGPHGVLVAAAGCHPSLLFHLRPNHWVGASLDPHPGRRVERLDLAHAAASMRELEASARGAQLVLVLRQDEVALAEADPAMREILRAGYHLAAVLENPFHGGCATLSLFRPAAP